MAWELSLGGRGAGVGSRTHWHYSKPFQSNRLALLLKEVGRLL